ncbi:MAG: DNA polymerase III subunit epsilon [Proteobacteria bacterium]|jgi:DNA polymerase-3 subunit epsilon|nr:DNA polymerase III subunit epsilon [Alphaproteobacteria bacterium]NCC03621.1 DNA polymerase III subunit epsilon [Pseudomonadota bacterium]
MREIVLDTETTGFDPLKGDRLVEIGCVEIMHHLPTGKVFHQYFNPDRDVPEAATRVHGLTNEFLSDKPFFAQEVDTFLEFIAGDPLVIHNAAFDMGFLNAELSRAGYKILPRDRAIDTLTMARDKFPGAPASLDALCKRFGIDLSERGFHGALLDARLLAEVYLELRGGRQPGFEMKSSTMTVCEEIILSQDRTFRAARAFPISEEELLAHEAFLSKIPSALWRTSVTKEGKA